MDLVAALELAGIHRRRGERHPDERAALRHPVELFRGDVLRHRGAFGADKWHIYYRSLDDLTPFVNPDDPSTWTINPGNLAGRNLWDGEYRDLRAADFSLLDPT